jgi:hypothetical protein
VCVCVCVCVCVKYMCKYGRLWSVMGVWKVMSGLAYQVLQLIARTSAEMREGGT